MAAVLSVVVAGIVLETQFHRWSSFAWLGAAIGLLLSTIGSHLRRATQDRIFFSLCLLLGATFSFYSGSLRERAASQTRQWDQSVQQLGGTISSREWSPVVVRGTIAQSMKYRKTSPAYPLRDPAAKPTLFASHPDRAEPAFGKLPRGSQGPPSTQNADWQTTTVISLSQVRTGGTWRRLSSFATLSINGRSDLLLPGDQVEVFGHWKLPSASGNPGQMDQAGRYAELGYGALVKADGEAQIRLMQLGSLWNSHRIFAMLGRKGLSSMERYVPFGQFELASALILGQRDLVEWRLQEDLLATGSIHMLSISGMHIEMLSMAMLMIGTATSIPRRPLMLGVVLLIWGYTLVCGSNPPVLRAALMLSVSIAAKAVGWQYSSLNNLAFAGLALVTFRPSVVFDLGTQLSFLAVAVLILTGERILYRVSPLRALVESRLSQPRKRILAVRLFCWEILRTSFWVWFMTAPLVWHGFHVISPIAIVLNLFLWLPLLVALLSGLGLILFGWIAPIGAVLGYVCGISLWLVDCFVAAAESIPLGHFWSMAPPFSWLICFYLLTIGFAVFAGTRTRVSRTRILQILAAWFLVGLIWVPSHQAFRRYNASSRGLVITVLDVGHGCHIWLELPNGELWCYDAGRMGDHERTYRGMVDSLWAERLNRIDFLILSHADSDHYNAMLGIAHRFHVGRFVTTPQVLSHDGISDSASKYPSKSSASKTPQTNSPTNLGAFTPRAVDPKLRDLLHYLKAQQVPIVPWTQGDYIEANGFTALVLHPNTQCSMGSDNSNSLCLILEYAGRRILLPGDLEPPGTHVLLSQPPVHVDLLVAPHHGSLHAQASKLLQWCTPEHVLISGSSRSLSEKVDQQYEGENRFIWKTARERAIRFHISPDGGVQTYTWKKQHWALTKSPDR